MILSPSVILAFALIYVIWGSTFLAIRWALTEIPPFLSAGLRFFAAGVLLFVLCRWREKSRITRGDWMFAAITGALLLVTGNGLVVFAEQTAASGVAALVIGTVPLWMMGLECFSQKRKPGVALWAGLALGIAGIALLFNPFHSGGALSLQNLALLMTASISWSIGSFLSRKKSPALSLFIFAAMQMLMSGLILLAISGARGEWSPSLWSAMTPRVIGAQIYLILMGSVVGFTAYAWLLPRVSLVAISTYAFVNPIVAVGLGTWLAREPLTLAIGGAMICIVFAVVLILWDQRRQAPAGPKPLVIYDGGCQFCAGNLVWLRRLDWFTVFDSAPYQDPRLYERYPDLTRAACEKAMHVVFPDGRIVAGADALRAIWLRLPVTFIAGLALYVPPFHAIASRLYAIVARNRHKIM